MNTLVIGSRIKDCSQGFCSFYCPQWCYIIFPPPPPPPLEDFPDNESSGPNFSPLIITIIGLLAGALLLLSYYAILSNYCRSRFSTARRDQTNHDVDVETGEGNAQEPWFVATNGLDEALVRSMATFKYRRREGLVEGTECSVCLSEFVEDERLKLLPKCSHAFHVICIDTWLKCHSNCPLCRANVAGPTSSAPPSLPPLQSSTRENLELGIGDQEVEQVNLDATKTAGRDGERDRRIRRSVSMDCVFEPRLLIADEIEEESNRQSTSREVECEMRTSEMKRSHSSGRWFVSK